MKKINIFLSTQTDKETASSGYGIILQYDKHEKKVAGYIPTKSYFDAFFCAISDSLTLLSEPCHVDIYIENNYTTMDIYLSEMAQNAKLTYENNCKIHNIILHDNSKDRKHSECEILAKEGLNTGQEVMAILLPDQEQKQPEPEDKKLSWW